MAGVLNFTLGLATSQFVRGLSAAGAALGGITGLAAGLNGVFKEIQEGGRLFDLSRRTNASVQGLFQLEAAFNDVGVSAGSVGTIIGQVQKALGGVNEQGEPTNEAFAKLGLSIDELKRLKAPEQINAIGAALAKLPAEEGMSLAAKIGGRGGAGDLLQIGRSAEDFAAALERAAAQGAMMERNAASFDRIGDTLAQLRLNGRGFFAGIAEGAAPGIQAVVDQLNNLDLMGFGQRIGDALTVGTEAFISGRFSELLELSFKSAIQGGSNFMLSKIAEWSTALQKAFAESTERPGFLKRAGAGALGVAAGLSALWNELGASMGIPGANEKADERSAQAQRLFEMAGIEKGILDGIDPTSQRNEFAERLKVLFDQLLADAKARAAAANPAAPAVAPVTARGILGGGSDRIGGLSTLEQLGILNLGGRAGQDYARQTATNTRETNSLIKTLINQNGRILDREPNFAHA